MFGELKTLYSDGLFEYIMDLWNIVDFVSNMFYVTWILCRATAWIIVHVSSIFYKSLYYHIIFSFRRSCFCNTSNSNIVVSYLNIDSRYFNLKSSPEMHHSNSRENISLGMN